MAAKQKLVVEARIKMKRAEHGEATLMRGRENERGAVAIIVALMLVLLIGFGALAIDLGHLFVVRNELKNAADAGALAGARVMFNDAGELNTSATDEATRTAAENMSEKQPVVPAAELGNWSFTAFSPAAASGGTFAGAGETNACRVTATLTTPASWFLAKIFGPEMTSFTLEREAVAYVGYAGTTVPGEINAPIVLCAQAIQDGSGNFACNVGRMINSGNQTDTIQTGGLSNFAQPCMGAANASSVLPLVCGSNPRALYLDQDVSTIGGMVQTVFDRLTQCWKAAGLSNDAQGLPTQPWPLKLPVIDCPGSNVGPCSQILGVVEVEVLWMTGAGDKTKYNNVPRNMGGWSCDAGITGQQCWQNFTNHFNLRQADGTTPLTYEDKTMYFKPVCQAHEVAGRTGGASFGVRAKFPVLVR